MIEIINDHKPKTVYDVANKIYPNKYCFVKYYQADENSVFSSRSLVEVLSIYDRPAEIVLEGGKLWDEMNSIDGITGEVTGSNLIKPVIGGFEV